MKFLKTALKDAYLIEIEPNIDERGFFARKYCHKEFARHGIKFKPVQANVSYNHEKHTLRGMHFQKPPYEEAKLIRCVRGAIYDVIVDVRQNSPTRNDWIGAYLSEENKKMIYVPKGFAHGFLTLEEDTEVSYLMSEFYNPDFGSGFRWDDPAFNIEWPASVNKISNKDLNWSPYSKEKMEMQD